LPCTESIPCSSEPVSLPNVKPETRFKCIYCNLILTEDQLVDGECPVCHNKSSLKEMCEHDHICTCIEPVTSSLAYCPDCGKPICPCGSHDVIQVSRVTGYLSEVSGWNRAKQAELKDRVRYNPVR